MAQKVREVLLVSTPYDAWIMEEDCRLSERIIHEYRGLNLSHPPIITWVPTAEEALKLLAHKHFDLIITMPRLSDMDASTFGQRVKQIQATSPAVERRVKVSTESWRELEALASELCADGQEVTADGLARLLLEQGVQALRESRTG